MKQKIGRKLLGVLLALVLVIGLVPGTGLTAYADINVAKVGETEYATLSEALNEWNDGTTLTLLADVETANTISMSSGKKTFNLNGHNITMTGNSGSVFQVTGGSSLTVNGTGSISGGKGTPCDTWEIRGGGFYVANNAKVTVNNVTITGNTAYYGGGVFLRDNATFTMNNGTIFHNHINNNSGYTSGGGVWIQDSGTFIMNGGSVTENTADSQIAGIHVFDNGTFKVSGNAIVTKNTRGGSQINVSGTITVDGELTEGANIGVYHDAGVFTNSTNTDYNDASKFTSDNASYAVGKNANGQLFLGTPVTVTYEVVNGTWSNDSTTVKTETVASGSKPASVPTGMKASSGYTGGEWNTNPAEATITSATTFTYTFTAKENQVAPTELTATKASSSTAADGKIGGVTSAMEYQKDGDTAWIAVGSDQTEITGLTEGTYKVRYKETADKNVSDATSVVVGVKENQTAPTELTATKASSSTVANGKIDGVTSAMEYQKDGDTAWTAVGSNQTEITGLTEGTYKVRYAETEDKNASPEATVEVGVKDNQATPTELTATKASSSTAADGKIGGVTSAMEYQKDGDTAWTAVGSNQTEITGLTAGTYKVRYKETADKNASDATSVVVGVKVAPTVTAPTAKALTYNGQAQELVTAGETDGGTMQYALGTATEATQPYTTSVPTATDAGTYYVWYKVKGDNKHSDTEPACVKVEIKEGKARYDVVSAQGVDHTHGDQKDAVIIVERSINDEATFDSFTGLRMDEKTVAGTNYEAKPGSLKLTLKASYLNTLSEGKHTATILFKDGQADATVTIRYEKDDIPKTGDAASPGTWILMMLLGATGIVGWSAVRKKKEARKEDRR